jgi:hypothetical protein
MALAPSQLHTAPGHRGQVTRWLTVVDARGRPCLQRVVARPGANSAVVHYKVVSNRAVVRQVVRVRELPDPDDVQRVVREHVPLETLVLTLDPAACPKCRQLSCMYLRHAVEALTFLQKRQNGCTPVSFLVLDGLLEPEEAYAIEDRSEDQPYDGGWEPGGIGCFDDRNQPQARIKITRATDAPAVTSPTPPLSRFLRDVAGDDTDGAAAVLAPIAERVLSHTVTYLPRLAGGWEDLFQHGMAVALPEARALSSSPGESLDDFAGRLERRVAMTVRHRLIDLIRRQDAADRNMSSISIEEVRERALRRLATTAIRLTSSSSRTCRPAGTPGRAPSCLRSTANLPASRAGSSAAPISPPSSGGKPRERLSCGTTRAILSHPTPWRPRGPRVSRRRWRVR